MSSGVCSVADIRGFRGGLMHPKLLTDPSFMEMLTFAQTRVFFRFSLPKVSFILLLYIETTTLGELPVNPHE